MNVYVKCPRLAWQPPIPPPKRKAPSETTLREDPDHT